MSHISVGLREILQTILIHVVKDAKPLEYFHTLFHHHALPSVTTLLYHDSDFGDSKLIWCSDFEPSHTLFHHLDISISFQIEHGSVMPDRPWGQFHEKALRFGWATQKTQETNSIINIRCPPWLPQYWIGALANDLQSSQLKDFESARTEAEFFLVASRAWIIFSCWSLTSRVFSHSISPPCTAICDYTALPWLRWLTQLQLGRRRSKSLRRHCSARPLQHFSFFTKSWTET